MAGRPVVPVASEGWPFVLVPLAGALLLAWAGWPKLAGVALALGLFMVFFFRDPERVVPQVAGAVLAPADGKVVEVRPQVEDPFVGAAQAISIFLSPLDVHVNRAPVAGLVVDVEYRPGGFQPAYRPEASAGNEQTRIAIQGDQFRVAVRQIAGVLARRVVCRVRPGDKLAAGERFGLIKFGSRTDVVIPRSVRLGVRVGDRVWAGETVLGVAP